MTTKESIQAGEELLKRYQSIVDASEGKYSIAPMTIEDKINILLAIEKDKLVERIKTISGRLVPLKKQYLLEFEMESAEANLRAESIVSQLRGFFGKEPKVITEQVENEINNHNLKENLSQEERNEFYGRMKGHLNFLKTKMK